MKRNAWFAISLLFCFIALASCKKDKNSVKTTTYDAKVVCGDCYWIVQNGTKVIANKKRGEYDESVPVQAKKGDTILFVGWNYSLTKNMDGYLYKGKDQLQHGVTHCGGNPSFFLVYYVP